jgi:hypothetical protein
MWGSGEGGTSPTPLAPAEGEKAALEFPTQGDYSHCERHSTGGVANIKLDFIKSSDEVRNSLLGLYNQVLDCPHFQGECAPYIKKVNQPFGPEISFVGKHYGEGGIADPFRAGRPNWPDIKPPSGTICTGPWLRWKPPIHPEVPGDEPVLGRRLLDAIRLLGPTRIRELYRGYRPFNTITGRAIRGISPTRPARASRQDRVEVILGEMRKMGLLRTMETCWITAPSTTWSNAQG